MRKFLISVAAFGFISAPAFAEHPEEAKPATKQSQSDLKLPSKAEMQEIVDAMPDFNAIMGDFVELAKDEELQDKMEKAGDSFKRRLDESGALELDENGIPNINKALEVMLFSFTEEEIGGELLDTAEELMKIMEKHIPED